jgi:hypothetical protein
MSIITAQPPGGGKQAYIDNAMAVASVGVQGTVSFSAYWADTVYANADVWTNPTGCNYFEVMAGTSLATAGHFLCIAWSEEESANLSAVLAAIGTGAASVAKTAKETTLTSSSNCGALKSDNVPFAIYSETPIKTIKIIAVGDVKVALLTTVTA